MYKRQLLQHLEQMQKLNILSSLVVAVDVEGQLVVVMVAEEQEVIELQLVMLLLHKITILLLVEVVLDKQDKMVLMEQTLNLVQLLQLAVAAEVGIL